LLNLPYRAEAECIERALSFHGMKPDMLLSLGGESFSVYTMRDGIIRNIVSTTKCAAGTGEFIVQQFQRMNLGLEDGLAAARSGKDVELATRCSVHCKSDATHKLNKGECRPADIAFSLMNDLAKKIVNMVEMAQWPTDLIVISGGLAKNELLVGMVRTMLPAAKIVLLQESEYLEAFGASLYAADPRGQDDATPAKVLETDGAGLDRVGPLRDAELLVDYRVRRWEGSAVASGASYILGLDAGSTTTKAVLFNTKEGTIDARCYLRTHGNPVAATRQCLLQLIEQVGETPIEIIQAGATGSGREMVSVYLDNCLSFNEILAHARAASEEIGNVDTLFEIGGQDSKFISFLKGIPIDYAMNEGCSAGTGSFLEESASVDMSVKLDEISERALRGGTPVAFGERCAAFINTDLRNALQQGAQQDDVLAGLVYSIADNYISRVVGARNLGDTIVFQGGVALNRSVALAIAARTGRKVVVPAHPELMGCVGTALKTRDLLERGDVKPRAFDLRDLVKGEMEEQGTFPCAACENRCEIRRISIRGKAFPFGGLCSKFESARQKKRKITEGIDMVSMRNQLMFEEFGPKPVAKARGTIGLPLALTAYELLPFYARFINELGYNVVLSKPSKIGNSKTKAALCYPCQVMHGAVYDLAEGVDYLWIPYVLEMSAEDGAPHSYTCPTTTLIPDIVRAAFGELSDKVLSPHIALRQEGIATTLKEMVKVAQRLGLGESIARQAMQRALAHYEVFLARYRELARNELTKILTEPTIILAGRPYTTCSPDVNLAIPRKIVSRGYHVVPADALPPLGDAGEPRNVWAFTQQMLRAVAYAKRHPDVYVCLLSCFSCGPDASIYHLIRQELEGQTFCYLEIDAHTAHAGIETRVGAFIDIIEERRRIAGVNAGQELRQGVCDHV
jgi:predicted CoA-substrate-specific enzyme activase